MQEAAEALMPEASLTAELIESMRARAGTEQARVRQLPRTRVGVAGFTEEIRQ